MAAKRTEESLAMIDATLKRTIEHQEAWNAQVQEWAGRTEAGHGATEKSLFELAEETRRHRDEIAAMREDAKRTAHLILQKAKRYAKEGRELDEAAVLTTLGGTSEKASEEGAKESQRFQKYREASPVASEITSARSADIDAMMSDAVIEAQERKLEDYRRRLERLKEASPAESIHDDDLSEDNSEGRGGGKPPGQPPKNKSDPGSDDSDSSDSDVPDSDAGDAKIHRWIRRQRKRAEKKARTEYRKEK